MTVLGLHMILSWSHDGPDHQRSKSLNSLADMPRIAQSADFSSHGTYCQRTLGRVVIISLTLLASKGFNLAGEDLSRTQSISSITSVVNLSGGVVRLGAI